MVRVYCGDIRDCLPGRSALEKALPPGRSRRMKAYLRDEDRLRCLAGWTIMARVLGMDGFLDEKNIFTGPHGKPYLRGGPFFSLSHSGNYVLLAVGGTEVGADTEQWRDEDFHALARTAFHASEREWLSRSMSAQRFFDMWAAKESYLKWLGTGLTREPSSFAVSLRGRSGFIPERPDLQVRLYDSIPGHSIAVCASGPPDTVLVVSLMQR